MSLRAGTGFNLFLLVAVTVVTFFFIRIAYKNPPTIRRLPALDAIDDAVGRATEMGRPLIDHLGMVRFSAGGENAALSQAALNVLSYVAHKCAQLDCKLIVPGQVAESMPLLEDTVRTAFTAEGVPEKFTIDTVRYLSEDSFVFQGAIAGLMLRERPVAFVGIGPMGLEAQTNNMNMARLGGITIAGASTADRMPDMACADYSLFSTEVYACGAYLSKEPKELGSIQAQDYIQVALVGLILVGLVLGALKNPWLANLLKI